MKKFLIPVLFLVSFSAAAQTDPAGRDSLANTADFQLKVRQAAINTSYSIVEAQVNDATLIKYGQLWIAQPQGSQVMAITYGVLRNPAIDGNSSQDQIQQEVGNIYVIQAYAWFGVSPIAQLADGIRSILNRTYPRRP